MCDGEYRGEQQCDDRCSGPRIYPPASTPSRSDRGADQLVFLEQEADERRRGYRQEADQQPFANSALPTDKSPRLEGDGRLRHITADAAEYSATVDNSERKCAQSQSQRSLRYADDAVQEDL